MKIPDSQNVVDKEWDKLKNIQCDKNQKLKKESRDDRWSKKRT